MAVNEVRLGASGAAQGKLIFQNGKLRVQYGTAPAWTDYITIDSAGLISFPKATVAASGLLFGAGSYPLLYKSDVDTLRLDGQGASNLLFKNGSYAGESQTGDWLYLINGVANGGVRLRPSNGAAAEIVQAGNAQAISVKVKTELTTIAAAATTDTAITVPLNAVVFAVSVRVTTVIPTAATFTVTGTTSGTTFNTAAVSAAVDSTDVGTASCPYKNGAAQTIRITPNLTPADATGRVRVTIHYYDITPATS